VISTFLGVTVLGLYSNYVTVLNAMTGTIILVFSSLTSVIGHLFAQEGSRSTRRYFEAFHLVNFLLGIVFYLGYYAIVDNLVTVFFGEGLTVARELTFVVSFNGFVAFLRQSGLTFRDATGTFYNDRWKPVFEGFLNVILSVVFIRWMGVTGVIVATIITNLLICHIVEPYVLYRHAFGASPKRHYIRNYAMIAIFAAALLMLHFTMVTMDNQWLELLVNGCISVGISGIVCLLTMLRYKDLLSLLLGMRGKKTNLSY
jgi:O-antigen/teichoic acid export membrane protein